MRVRAVLEDDRGAVYVEFLLVFMPVFLFFLAVVELGFVYAGKLVVQHAATRAARAAAVILDDDPARYRGEPRGQLDLAGSAGTPSPIEAFMSGVGLDGAGGDGAGGARFRDIRAAASVPLLASAPSAAQLQDPERSIASAIGQGSDRAGQGARRYNRAAMAVTFPTAPGATTFRSTFGTDDLVTVRVTYLLHCAVPLVPQLMCDSPGRLRSALLPEEQAQLDLTFLSSLPGARFLVLRGEATLRNQGAGYLYAGQEP
jgi:hypothetical protein